MRLQAQQLNTQPLRHRGSQSLYPVERNTDDQIRSKFSNFRAFSCHSRDKMEKVREVTAGGDVKIANYLFGVPLGSILELLVLCVNDLLTVTKHKWGLEADVTLLIAGK